MAEVAERTVTQDDLFSAILRYEAAGDTENANKVRVILARDFPDAQQDIQLQPLPELEYTDEQIQKNAENAALARERDNLVTIAESKHIGDFPIQAVLNAFTSGYMFVGEYMDEAVGAVHGDEAKENVRQLNVAFRETFPKTNFALRMGGGVTSAIPLGTMAMTQKMYKFLQGLPGFWRYIGQALTGGTIGGTEGLISGAGIQGEGETGGYQTRLENSMDLAIGGTMFGAGGAVLGQGVTDVGAMLWTRLKLGLKDQSIPVIKELFNIGDKAAQVIKETVQSATAPISVLKERLLKGGNQSQIADADQIMASLLDIINVQGGPASSEIKKSIWGRAQTVAQGLDAQLDKFIKELPFLKGTTPKQIKSGDAIKMDAKDLAISSAKKSSAKRTEAYTKAYAHKIDYNSPEGKAILEILSRIDPSVKQAAMKTANKRLAWNKQDVGQQGFKVGDDGILQWVENPNTLQLDYIKRALGELGYSIQSIQKTANKFVEHPDAKLYRDMYTAINRALKKANPNYSAAVRLGQDNITRRNALEIGANMLDDGMNVNTLKRMLETAGDAEREMAKYGLRGAIEDQLNNVKRSINSPNIDINQMNVLFKSLSSKNVRNKIIELLGKKNARQVFKSLDRAEMALSLKAEIAKGSQTAARISGKETLEEITDAGVLQNIARGELPLATKELIAKITQGKRIFGKRKHKIMKEIANAMLDSKGGTARANFKKLYDAVKNGETTQLQQQEIAELIASRITITPVNFATTTMEDTDLEDKAVLGVSNFLQGLEGQ